MLQATLATGAEDLTAIHQLNTQNLKTRLSVAERADSGFVTWLYPLALLEQMHALAPSVVIRDEGKLVAYALTTLREAAAFHPDLAAMFRHFEAVRYKDAPLLSLPFYCMGQICVAKSHRGRGLVKALYEKHRAEYSARFDFLLTEISTSNPRSLKAHAAIGFKTIHTYQDALDEWQVVVWDWKENPGR